MRSLKNSLKRNARNSQEPADECSDDAPDWVTTNKREPLGESPIYFNEDALAYLMNLKPLYSDISFDDLTSTLNYLHNENFKAEDIEAKYVYECKYMIARRKGRNAALHWATPPNIMELDGPLLWLKETAFIGEETGGPHYNRPISTLAKHRRNYEAALAILKKSATFRATILLPYRPLDVARLSKPGPITVEDLRDLLAVDLEQIYVARENSQEPMLPYWKQETSGRRWV
ncbi:MAG: hypothetical protein LQ339_006789 [Xanthoria mediterranea]|nr:MAG: hypothetical protein LQ339_006789 [Xanthoria mediterranea]